MKVNVVACQRKLLLRARSIKGTRYATIAEETSLDHSFGLDRSSCSHHGRRWHENYWKTFYEIATCAVNSYDEAVSQFQGHLPVWEQLFDPGDESLHRGSPPGLLLVAA